MKLEYALSDKAQKKLFEQGEDDDWHRTIEFSAKDLTPEQRKAWFHMFGNDKSARLQYFEVYGGRIYEDGSVSGNEPRANQSAWFEQDRVLTRETVGEAIVELHKQYKEVEDELGRLIPKWKEARKEYETKLAKERAEQKKAKENKEKQEKARLQRLANLDWVQQLQKKLDVETSKEAETKRFCEKFGLEPEDLQTQDISDRPYVRISATIPIKVAGFERKLEITNRVYETIGEDPYSEFLDPDYSDLSIAVAETLAKIFKGKVESAINYDRREAWLNVICEQDTINVATAELRYANEDC